MCPTFILSKSAFADVRVGLEYCVRVRAQLNVAVDVVIDRGRGSPVYRVIDATDQASGGIRKVAVRTKRVTRRVRSFDRASFALSFRWNDFARLHQVANIPKCHVSDGIRP